MGGWGGVGWVGLGWVGLGWGGVGWVVCVCVCLAGAFALGCQGERWATTATDAPPARAMQDSEKLQHEP